MYDAFFFELTYECSCVCVALFRELKRRVGTHIQKENERNNR